MINLSVLFKFSFSTGLIVCKNIYEVMMEHVRKHGDLWQSINMKYSEYKHTFLFTCRRYKQIPQYEQLSLWLLHTLNKSDMFMCKQILQTHYNFWLATLQRSQMFWCDKMFIMLYCSAQLLLYFLFVLFVCTLIWTVFFLTILVYSWVLPVSIKFWYWNAQNKSVVLLTC